MMRLRYPLLTVFIFAAWLALAERVTPAQVVLAAFAALGGAWMLSRLQVPATRVRRARTIARLIFLVVSDIVRSNIAVARIILSRSAREHSNFMVIPLDMKSRNGLAFLACIITATPGTLWVSYNARSGDLVLHILDLVDENEWLQIIKGRYERLLMEIFE